MAKRKRNAQDEATPTFEEAFEQLQQIVVQLEDGALGLEESLAAFENGVTLLRTCYRVLDDTERKIELLVGFDADGNPLTEAFDDSATIEEANGSAGRRKATNRAAEDDSANGLF